MDLKDKVKKMGCFGIWYFMDFGYFMVICKYFSIFICIIILLLILDFLIYFLFCFL